MDLHGLAYGFDNYVKRKIVVCVFLTFFQKDLFGLTGFESFQLRL
jgi:hypothetical protein